MASKSTQVRARKSTGDEVHLSHSQSDSPILDVNSLERLHNFRPDAVDFVLEQTKAEAEYRRREERRMITFTFIERMGGVLIALLVCAFGIFGSLYAAHQGFTTLASIIAGTCIGTLAVAFLKRS